MKAVVSVVEVLSSIVQTQQQQFKFEVEVEDAKMTEVEVEFDSTKMTTNHGVNNMLLPMMIWMMNRKNRKKCSKCKCQSTHLYKVPAIPCGPKECKLKCKGGKEVCYMSLLIRCIQEPCCPIWSCQTCPPQPEFGSKCKMSQAGMSCDYGSQKCCGEKYPEVTMTCDGSNW